MAGACPPVVIRRVALARQEIPKLVPTGGFFCQAMIMDAIALRLPPDAILPSPRQTGGGFLRQFFQIICICFT